MLTLYLTFEDPPYCFPQQLHQFTFPSAQRFWFLHILANAHYFPLFDDSHPRGCEMVFPCVLRPAYMPFSCWIKILGQDPSTPSGAPATGLAICGSEGQSMLSPALLPPPLPHRPPPLTPGTGFLPRRFQRSSLAFSRLIRATICSSNCQTVYQQQALLCTLLICKTSNYPKPGCLTLM